MVGTKFAGCLADAVGPWADERGFRCARILNVRLLRASAAARLASPHSGKRQSSQRLDWWCGDPRVRVRPDRGSLRYAPSGSRAGLRSPDWKRAPRCGCVVCAWCWHGVAIIGIRNVWRRGPAKIRSMVGAGQADIRLCFPRARNLGLVASSAVEHRTPAVECGTCHHRGLSCSSGIAETAGR